ncbi:GGDEF domain-containing protein [Bermanella marisrubri]|uniref:diguanylate cyclase n=1 Tax=Bermanella marisrubri TaxID=207949 RepID=Q1N5W0_9GAMM|nr:GGDEF domain-containing protein [Bermanella marisrubri]EAT13832.1 Response regulator containing a CheY-like receiver domain and a GGDEF domain [Oceanobacter sp. RED65] [Bermanella marisrubri]QIZ84595.1 GGDEF domain-containing protein [Bermanella marisrubri]
MLQSEKQAIRLRRAILANLGTLGNVVLCAFAAYLGYFVIEWPYVVSIAAVIWLGHCVMVVAILRQWNLRLKDASMTFPQMFWVAMGISVLMFFANDIRSLLLMAYLLILSFGAFRLRRTGFYLFTLFTVVSYGLSLLMIYRTRPDAINLVQEFFIFSGFVMVIVGFAFMGSEFSSLRQALGERHRQLKGAMSKIEELAITDELTGLYNRRHVMEILNQQRALANRSQYRFTVCFLDLDHFKKVNDQYGHPFGDKVLKRFASLVRTSLREVDIGARIGGEEFILILADTCQEDAHEVVRRMAQRWQQTLFEPHESLVMTLSAGITEFHPPETLEAMIERADELLYEAKRDGRNCVKIEQVDRQATLDLTFPDGDPA